MSAGSEGGLIIHDVTASGITNRFFRKTIDATIAIDNGSEKITTGTEKPGAGSNTLWR